MPSKEQVEKGKENTKAYKDNEAVYNALSPMRVAELMTEAGHPVDNDWVNRYRHRVRSRKKKSKKQVGEQQVLLPEKDALHTAVQSVVKAMKARHIERLVVTSGGNVTVESVESFSVL